MGGFFVTTSQNNMKQTKSLAVLGVGSWKLVYQPWNANEIDWSCFRMSSDWSCFQI
jgi:hypothetical protein